MSYYYVIVSYLSHFVLLKRDILIHELQKHKRINFKY